MIPVISVILPENLAKKNKSGISYDFLCPSMSINKNRSEKRKVVVKKFLFGVSIVVSLSEMNYEKGTLHHPCHSLTGPLWKYENIIAI